MTYRKKKLAATETIRSNNKAVILQEHPHTDLDAQLFESVGSTNFMYAANNKQLFYDRFMNVNTDNPKSLKNKQDCKEKMQTGFVKDSSEIPLQCLEFSVE